MHNMCGQCWTEHGQHYDPCLVDCGCHDAPVDDTIDDEA